MPIIGVRFSIGTMAAIENEMQISMSQETGNSRRMAEESGHLEREKRTVTEMIRIYCGDHHRAEDGLCSECNDLLTYAIKRLDCCLFGADKPICANCQIHCYKPAMREHIHEVMRYAGPRMLWRHPVMAARHLLDKSRPAPDLPRPR